MRKIYFVTSTFFVTVIILTGAVFLTGQGRSRSGSAGVESFWTPEGFKVEIAATPEKTGSLIAMTFDSRGRPVVSREKGPVMILEDRNHDGQYETFLTFTDKVTNCHGLCFVGNVLYAVGDGPQGTALYRITDRDGDSQGDLVEVVGRLKGRIGEHGPHALLVGPEGLLYIVIGNHAGVAETPDPLSPHRGYEEDVLLPRYFDPNGHARSKRAPGATIFRLDFEGNKWQLVAGGWRNPYDAGFNLAGELFTFDADMEWDLGLPWFRPVRTHHVVPGGDYGWRTGSSKWPDYFPDSLPAMTDIGRGSPVGVEFYLHHVYPKKYHGAFLLGDWSRGRIYAGLHRRVGATYEENVEELVVGRPINVTDLEVGPDGFVYYTTGGRNSQGGLYRISYSGPQAKPRVAFEGIEAALAQPQPRSAWGRTRLSQLKNKLGSEWGMGLLKKIQDGRANAIDRARALELLQVYGPAPDLELLVELSRDPQTDVRAAATLYLGLHTNSQSKKALLARLADSDAFVQRRACEALVRTHITPTTELDASFIDSLWPLLGHSERFVRYSARELLERTNRNLWRDRALKEEDTGTAIISLLALVQTISGTWDMDELLSREQKLLQSDLSDDELLRLMRIIQLSFIRGEGVQWPKLIDPMGQNLLDRFPSGDWRLNRELARTLAYLQVPGTVEKLLEAMSRETNDREQAIFYVYCLRTISQGWSREQREVFIRWFEKTQKEDWRGGFSFSGFLEAMWTTWLESLPEDEKKAAMVRLPKLSPVLAAGQTKRIPTFSKSGWTQKLSKQELTEFLVWDPMAYRGSAERGKLAYQKAFCDSCHRLGDVGSEAGPDLTTVGMRFSREDLIQAILFPSRTVSDLWNTVEVTVRDGNSYLGTVANEDAQVLVLRQMGGPRVYISKRDIVKKQVSEKSSMPEGLLNILTSQEVWDLFAYLEKGSSQ